MTLYQLPLVTSWLLKRNNHQHLTTALSKSIGVEVDLVPELQDELQNLWQNRPETLQRMINWYRANIFYNVKEDISIPTLLLWGENEQFILKDLAHRSLDLLAHEHSQLEFIPESIHASQLEQADLVNQKIETFISIEANLPHNN